MNDFLSENVLNYINSHARNRIIFHQDDISILDYVDVGRSLSEAIYNLKDTSKLSMRALSELDRIFEHGIKTSDVLGRYLAIFNLGILFEPELKIDFLRLIDKYSLNQVLLIKWDGEMESNMLFFLTKENGVKINVQNLSHIHI
ncbi:hypothetical protein SAMN06295967_1259 [Belliella buryatensis]|uniref:Uncharacterized protein n=1 Tax=Belliella buryatensis TaxID=1500549 RepID=A0A239H5K0_9BACT|nr:hypothetical protein [Belliella buryatensis]SNS76492.1 hypothetical protein SAMN06295967_1259 [Belliella buryatensis]